MKKLLIVSDNHFQQKEFLDIVKHHQDADYFIHCGDSQWQPDDERIAKFIIVRGNNDMKFPDDQILEVEEKKILITHGHQQHVFNYGDRDNLDGTKDLVTYAIQNYDANVVFYGHTHVPECHLDRDVFVLNPGSTNFPRSFTLRVQSYAVVTIDGDDIFADFYSAKTHENITKRVI